MFSCHGFSIVVSRLKIYSWNIFCFTKGSRNYAITYTNYICHVYIGLIITVQVTNRQSKSGLTEIRPVVTRWVCFYSFFIWSILLHVQISKFQGDIHISKSNTYIFFPPHSDDPSLLFYCVNCIQIILLHLSVNHLISFDIELNF